MIKKRVRAKEVIGDKFSPSEKEKHDKYKIWTPENDDMIVSSKGPLSVKAFERKLKELDNRIFITFRPERPQPEAPFGHAVRFRDPELPEGHDPITGVGKGGQTVIPAQSTFNHYKNPVTQEYETRIDALGWEAAEEAVINYIVNRVKNKG